MPSTQLMRTGAIEQILRTLSALASSPAYLTELNLLISNMTPAITLGNFTDANQTTFTLNIDDTQFGPPAGWVGKTTGASNPGFAKIYLTDQLRISGGPFPVLQLIAAPGTRGNFDESWGKEWIYVFDAIVICAGTEPGSVQREALILADAFEQLVYRNQQLGGLVELIDAPVGPMPSGAVGRGQGVVAAAHIRFDVRILRVSGRG